MQPLETSTNDGARVESPISAGGVVAQTVASEHAPTKAASADLTSQGFLERAAAFGRQHKTGSELSGLITSLSAPGTGGTSSVLTLYKTSSYPSALPLGKTWEEPAANARLTIPTLPNPDSWANGAEHFGQPGQAVGSRDPYSAGDPALQVRCCMCWCLHKTCN